MSRDFRHGMKQVSKPGFKKAKQDKNFKIPTKQHRENVLRHAVRHHDVEVFEDYDERNM